mgnify:FL=1
MVLCVTFTMEESKRVLMTTAKILYFKQELKKLKKEVKQMESQRDLNRSWDHKEILIDKKKEKIQMKQLLDELEEMRDKDET